MVTTERRCPMTTPNLETRYVFTITAQIGEVTSAGEIGTVDVADGAVVAYSLAYVFDADTEANGYETVDQGQIGVLPRHAPLLTQIGFVVITGFLAIWRLASFAT